MAPKTRKVSPSTETDAMDMSPWFELMAESTRFLEDRMRQNTEFQQAMLNCKTPMELAMVQSEFIQKAAAQYSTEMARCFELASKSTLKTAKSAGTAFSRTYDDVPV